MPQTFQDAEGNEITAYTEDEVKAIEEDKANVLKEAEEKLSTINQELTKYKEKDLNFSNLRSQKDDVEKKIEAMKQETEQKIEAAKKEVHEANMKEHYQELLNSLSGGDDEAKKKIEYHYGRLSDPTTNKAEVEKKLRDAMELSRVRQANSTGNAFASSGAAPIKPSNSNRKWSEDEKELGKEFAAAGGMVLKDEDFK